MYKKNTPTNLDRRQFLKIFGGVYEHSEWIAEQAFDTGLTENHNNAKQLQLTMEKIVDNATKSKKLNLLCAHPDLAGKLAISGNLTAASSSEQASAGLENCTREEFNEFKNLNTKYKKKFGFPFILAVSGYDRKEILNIFKNRLINDFEIEFKEALNQVHRIALLRLENIE